MCVGWAAMKKTGSRDKKKYSTQALGFVWAIGGRQLVGLSNRSLARSFNYCCPCMSHRQQALTRGWPSERRTRVVTRLDGRPAAPRSRNLSLFGAIMGSRQTVWSTLSEVQKTARL